MSDSSAPRLARTFDEVEDALLSRWPETRLEPSLDRIQALTVNPSKPRSPDFALPADFRIDDYVAAEPWQHRFHEPVEVTLLLQNAQAPLAARLFPGAAAQPLAPGGDPGQDGLKGGVQITVRATFLDGLLRHALSLSPDCKVLAPERAVERFRELATKVSEAHANG